MLKQISIRSWLQTRTLQKFLQRFSNHLFWRPIKYLLVVNVYSAVAIVVCADKNLEKFPGLWVQDCSAATENMLLAATARGLGVVWTAVYPFEDRVEGIKNLLNLPMNVIPLCVVPVGHPAETPVPVDRFNPSCIHRDTW